MKLPAFLLPVAFLLFGLFNAGAANYYIDAAGPVGDGSGSSAANAADASTAAKYRAINQTHKTPGTVIVYAPGTYLVTPAFSMYDGVTHQGAGIDSTIIKIEDGAANGTFAPMWLADKGTISNFKFQDATIDFNTTHQPWWSRGQGCCIALAFSTADHCTVQRVKFINFGAKNQESFPVFFITSISAPGNLNHNLVDSCIFTQPVVHGNTKGGLTCINLPDAEPKITSDNTNVVSNCQFLKLKAPEYSDFNYTQCCSCPVATHNKTEGVDTLWFVEPGTQTLGNNVFFKGQTIEVTGNTLIDTGGVARILMHANGTFAGNMSVRDNKVGMTQHPYMTFGPRPPEGVIINQYEKGNPSVGNITVENNTFTAPLPKSLSPCAVSASFTEGSGQYFHLASLTVRNNTFVNFPQDGKELQVITNPTYNPNYTHAENQFAK